MVIDVDLRAVSSFLVEELKAELRAQGHVATGSLLKSIDSTVARLINGDLSIDISMLSHWAYVEYGVKSGKVPFGGTKRGVSGSTRRSLYIEALKKWIRQKGLETEEKKVTGFAFAIAHTHKREGIPSKKSFRFSRNSRRRFFHSHAILTNKGGFYDMTEEEMTRASEEALFNRINKLVA